MHPALLAPAGYPMDGLVAYFDLMVDNLVLWSETFENPYWAKIGLGVGSVAVVTDGYGAAGQSRIQMALNGGTAAGDQSGVYVGSMPTGFDRIAGLEAKTTDGSTKSVQLRAGGQVTTMTLTGEWQEFPRTVPSGDVSTVLYIWLRGGQGVSDSADILVRKTRYNPGTSLRDYVATTDLQSLGSLYGKSVTAQRGTTAGAEASDGSFGANGWNGVTDDVIVSSALADGTMAAPFDIPLVGLFNGTAGTIVSLAASAVTTHYQRVAYNGSGQIRIGTKAGAGAETFSADLAVSTADILGLRFRSDGTTLTLTNHATGTSVTLASQSPTGACRLGLGCTAGSTVADIASAITATLGTLHGQQLSTAGWTRAYRDLKARAARKGVTVTP